MKVQKSITITNTFQNILNQCGHKPNKGWVDKFSEFYNKSIKPWLKCNDIGIYSTHDEGISVAAERFITNLKNKV